MIDNFKTPEHEWLSNMYPCRVEVDGIVYPSSEHAYVAMKTQDLDERVEIAQLQNGYAAKKYGRGIPLHPAWNDEARLRAMLRVLRAKFNQNRFLARKLLDTGDQELIEGNTWDDTFWGFCKGVGFNNLGALLMVVRDELKNNSQGT